MTPSPPAEPAPLAPESYLQAIRDALSHRRYRTLIDELRNACDDWTIGSGTTDPCEPLTNRGRHRIDWRRPTWDSISSDLMGPLRWTVERIDLGKPFKQMPIEMAGYVAFVYLELCAIEEPAHDEWETAVAHPLVIAARRRERPDLFRRYLLGWYDRAGALPWNRDTAFDEGFEHYCNDAAHHAALAVALGSAEDPLIGTRVLEVRAWLDRDPSLGKKRFRDITRHGDKPLRQLWMEIASASSPDAAAWAESMIG
ncbi:MAG: hypothetical protein AAF138_00195 [Planctomycetota bacterium]